MQFLTAGLYLLTPSTTVNGEQHVESLKEKMAIHMHIHKCNISMHDGASRLCYKQVKIYLTTASVTALEWSKNTPDLDFCGKFCRISLHISRLQALVPWMTQ